MRLLRAPARRRTAQVPELRGAQVNIDAAIKAAQERLHRQIGQWGRFAHRKVAERAAIERYAYLAKNDPQRAGLEYRIRVTNRTPE